MERIGEISALNKIRDAHLNSHDWKQEGMNFIPLEGCWSPFADDGFNLDDEMNKFLSSSKKVLLLLGDSGSGKSLYTQGLANRLWQSYDDQSPIPLWISLPAIKNPQHILVQEYLKSFGLTDSEIETLKKTRMFIFILDAYDEIRILKNLYVSNGFSEWNGKIIVTCRREYLYTAENYKLYFVPFSGEKALYNGYVEMIVRPFNHNQIQHYLKKYTEHHETEWKDWQQYEQAIESIPGLKNLIATPFMLKLSVEALPTILTQYQQSENQKKLTQAALYDVFIEQWFIRQEQKLKDAKLIPENEDIKPAFWNYAKNIAQIMHEKGITQITYEQNNESDLFEEMEIENSWKVFFDSDNPKTALLQTACLIRKMNISQYAFIHSSLLEYFLTRNLYEILLDKKTISISDDFEESIKPITINPPNPNDYFNQHLFVKEPNTIQFLADRVEEQPSFKDILFQKIMASKNNPHVKISAANAITILNKAKVSFSQRKFDGIQIEGADLSNAILDSTDLSDSNLSEVNLRGTWLNNAKLCRSLMSKVEFGELPYLETTGESRCVAYSSDGTYLAAGSGKDIIIYEKKGNYQKIAELKGHSQCVQDLLFQPHGTIVVSGDYDGTIRLWNIQNQSHTFVLAKVLPNSKPCLAFHPNGKMLATTKSTLNKLRIGGNPGEIFLWDIQDQKKIGSLYGSDSITLAFSGDGNLLASGSQHRVCLWDVQTKKQTAVLDHVDYVSSIAFHPNLPILASASAASGRDGNIVCLWDLQTQNQMAVLKHNNDVNCLIFSPNGNMLASGSDNVVYLWNIESQKQIAELKGHTDKVNCIVFSPDGQTLASVSCNELMGSEHRIRRWNVDANSNLSIKSKAHTGWINCIAISSNGTLLASGGHDKTICLWNTNSQNLISELKGHTGKILCVAFNPSCNLLASASEDKTIRLWNTENQKFIAELKGHTGKILCVAFNPVYNLLASASEDKTIRLWNTQNQKFIAELKDDVFDILFHPNGNILASASKDLTIRFWDIQNQKQTAEFRTSTKKIAFHPNGHMLASVDSKKIIRLSNVENQKQIAILKGYTHEINCIAFSMNGKILASSSDKELCLWDMEEQKFVGEIKGLDKITDIAFSPNNQWIAGILIRTVCLWNVKTGFCTYTLTLTDSIKTLSFSQYEDKTYLCVCVNTDLYFFEMVVTQLKASLVLIWSSSNTGLRSTMLDLSNVIGLNQEQELLLNQRGAIGNILCKETNKESLTYSLPEPINNFTITEKEKYVYQVYLVTHTGSSMPLQVNDLGKSNVSPSKKFFSQSKKISPLNYRREQLLKKNPNAVSCMALLPNGNIVCGSLDDTISVWKVMYNQCLKTIDVHTTFETGITSIAVLSDFHVITGDKDGILKIWDIVKGQVLNILEGHTESINCILIHPNNTIISASGRTIKIWDTTGLCLKTITGHEAVRCMGILANGNIVSGSISKYCNELKEWDLKTGECRSDLSNMWSGRNRMHFRSMAVLRNGNIVCGSFQELMEINIHTGECIKTLKGEHTNWIDHVVELSNGHVVSASSSDDSGLFRREGDPVLRVWDLNKGICINRLKGHTQGISSILVMPDDRLISASDDKSLIVWGDGNKVDQVIKKEESQTNTNNILKEGEKKNLELTETNTLSNVMTKEEKEKSSSKKTSLKKLGKNALSFFSSKEEKSTTSTTPNQSSQKSKEKKGFG